MQGTMGRKKAQLLAGVVGHGLVLLSVMVLAALGQVVPEQAGWVLGSDGRVVVCGLKPGRCEGAGAGSARAADWLELGQSAQVALLRSVVLWGLWSWSGRVGPGWLWLWPWLIWWWQGAGVCWPGLRRQRGWWLAKRGLSQGQQWLLVSYVGLGVVRWLGQGGWPRDAAGDGGPWLGAGCLICGGEEAQVTVERQDDGSYQATLCGHFTLQVAGDHAFRRRLLLLFLSLLTQPGPQRKGRRTRDGRTPFVTEMQLGAWFGVPHPDVSRLYKYWLNADWANLLSLHSAEVLTAELLSRIVEVCASFPWWDARAVRQHLREQGVPVSLPQVEQAMAQSGWARLRETLLAHYDLSSPTLQLRDGWLVGQLLAQVRSLLVRLEAGPGATPEQRSAVADLQQLAAEAHVVVEPPVKTEPWLVRLEQVLLGPWQTFSDGQVRCPACGSTTVKRKGHKPRFKKYYDEKRKLQRVAVYRYFCCNPVCQTRTFTDLPADLLPYSPYRTETHLLALQMYAWGYSTYRRTGTALGVASLTIWRWVSAWGDQLLPIAALFGVVKSSGIVGVDEKYVLVPKNNKPVGEMRRWMYVYLAVDVWTYDLLHIAIYPRKTDDSAEAFLLALRCKGYHPQVIVTDLRQDYGPVIQRVFPQAVHHLCIFHALQDLQKHIKDVYGPDYANQQLQVQHLKQQIYAIFDAETLALATQRYAAVLALRQDYVQAQPQAAKIFDFLERHWPKLANSIGVSTIPDTNNTVELVIRRFDQHYQNFCGFESIADAQRYLAVFEKIYRFTPFSPDAQPRIRSKSPLQLAGYDVASRPITTLATGLSILWPTHSGEANCVPDPLR